MTAKIGRRIAIVAGILSFCIAILASCSPSLPPTETSDRVRLGTTAKVVTLDPADAYELSSFIAISNLGDRLYTYASDATEIVPQLATSLPEVSDDGLTYRIPLRSDVVFHDGTPFDAEAMVFSLTRFMKNKGRPSFLLSDLVESVAATDEYELTLRLNYPFAAFTALLTFPGFCPVSPNAYNIGEGEFQPNQFVGTGPYILKSYGTDALQLDRFEDYWGETPQNSGIDVQRFSSKANLYNAFRTGAIDVAYQDLDPDQIHSLEELAPQEGWHIVTADSPTISYLVVNVEQPPLDRLEVRQALAYIIDRPLLSDRVFYGQAEPLYTLLPRSFDASEPVFATRYGDGNLDTAKTLLREEGFSTDNPLEIEIWFASSSNENRLAATVLKALADRDLEGLVRIEPRSVEAATAYGYLDKGVYPTFMLSWYADFFDADNYLKPFLDCSEGSPEMGCQDGESQYHGSFYYSDRANELIERQRQTTDVETRDRLLGELQEMVAEAVPYIPLWQTKDYAFAQANIDGVALSSTQQILLFSPIRRDR
ncbi:ABC transporter substrate-binding protein [Baaleninema simplex]|uniref:ABC transporter substrate-binding protein n=1 Tax=Baaleninema simplex TaxID=2862350 RepID=UPI0003473551|nr:ABC transporter substrate-binding protein [Baaleninema simplex]